MSRPQKSSDYRPDIDGLRALAIMAVLIFHARPSWLSGGFLGVDIFFVISGFLITGIIQRDLELGRFSISRFYEKRIRRIIPALYAVLIASVITAYFLLLPSEMEEFARSVHYTVFSISNFYFLDQFQNYFGGDAHSAPLLNTWSLAVEEQYYLFFPLLLILFHKFTRSKKTKEILFVALFLTSLIAAYFIGKSQPMSAFFMLPFRLWEMMAGSLLALMPISKSSHKFGDTISQFSWITIIFSFLLVSEINLIPGLSALPACLATVAIIHYGRSHETHVKRLLSLKPLVALGLISYSVYLWHWPLMVFARDLHLPPIALISISIILGWLSWKFIEEPFRKPTFLTRKKIFTLWALSTFMFVSAAMFVKKSHGLAFRFPEKARYFLAFKERPTTYLHDVKKHYDPSLAPTFGTPNVEPTIALLGDSHADALAPIVDQLARENGLAFRLFTISGQSPIEGIVAADKGSPEKSGAYSTKTLALLAANPKLNTVVLHSRWSIYNRGKNELGPHHFPALFGHDFKTRNELDSYYAQQIRETIRQLLAAGKKVVLIYPVPEPVLNVPDFLARKVIEQQNLPEYVPCHSYFPRQQFVIDTLDALQDPKIIHLRPAEILLKNGQLQILKDNQPLFSDDDHLSEAGAAKLKPLLAPIFKFSKLDGR